MMDNDLSWYTSHRPPPPAYFRTSWPWFSILFSALVQHSNLAVALMILIQESCAKIYGEDTNEVGGGVNGNATGMMAAPG